MLGFSRYQWTVLFAAWLGWGFDVFDGLLFNYVAPNCVPTLLGIITKLDLLRVFRPDPRRLLPDLAAIWAERVEDLMRGHVVTVTPEDAVVTAVDCMLSWRFRSLPVVERRGGKECLVGIVSRGDVLRGLSFESDDSG